MLVSGSVEFGRWVRENACFTGRDALLHLQKWTWKPKSEGFEDDFPFQMGDFQSPAANFCRGVEWLETKLVISGKRLGNPSDQNAKRQRGPNDGSSWKVTSKHQWLFLVPQKGGRWHIIPQLAVYTTYIPLIYCLLGGYMLPTTF